jgi:hypothetical protein
MGEWKLASTPIIPGVTVGGTPPPPSLSYHQNTFDFLNQRLPVSPKLLRQIERREQKCGQRLPASLRQWYSLGDAVSCLKQYSNTDYPVGVNGILSDFVRAIRPGTPENRRYALLIKENQFCCCWFVQLDGRDDPAVIIGDYRKEYGERTRDVVGQPCAASFSEFVFQWVWQMFADNWLDPIWGHSWPNFVNGLWLRSPREEALPNPVADFLYENLTGREPDRDENGVLTYHYYSATQRLRVTTDRNDVLGGKSAWWLHADTEEDLYQLARLVIPWLNLRQTLSSETAPGKKVLARLRDS